MQRCRIRWFPFDRDQSTYFAQPIQYLHPTLSLHIKDVRFSVNQRGNAMMRQATRSAYQLFPDTCMNTTVHRLHCAQNRKKYRSVSQNPK